MRRLFGRPTTVRTRIVALSLAPAIALLILWSFAMVSVTGELRALVRVQGVYEDFGTPVDTAVGQIQIERRLAAAYLGGGHRNGAALDLLEQERRTDRAVNTLRDAVQDGDRDRLSGGQQRALDSALAATGKLEGLRERVLTGRITWDGAVTEYSALVEPGFRVQSALTALQAGRLAREAQVVTELVRVREFVSREDALVAGARAAGSLTDRQYDMLTATIEDRRVFEATYVPDLPPDSRTLFERFRRDDVHRALTSGEDALLRAGADGAGRAVAADSWRTTTDRAVQRYMLLCTQAAKNSATHGREFAYRELAKAVAVAVAGLVAMGLSLWLSVRGARRISRRLETLRDAADLLTTRQLPDVMERLGAGEQVDALAEAPPLAEDEAGSDEIGQVSHAFNAARHAAVGAAVKQSTLRSGLFAVLLNIARRNQALVHRQLKLVDTLERRTDDPDILEELFRIDHLTTRMRRHAESLIILSGAAPGRRWRRPVPIADVVSSAVGEIEDYARVVVPPMPDVGIAADAVADVVHLLAELLENATVFSPPRTRVTLRTDRARGGFVLEIDDRGLGLGPDEIEAAHRTLSGPGDFDPTRHDRLGLYVVGRLAARHGIEVTLTRSPYGGTTAVVLLPATVLAEAATEAPSERDAAAPGPRTPARRDEPSGPGLPVRQRTALLTREREQGAAPEREFAPEQGPAPEPARTPERELASEPRRATEPGGTPERGYTAEPGRAPGPERAPDAERTHDRERSYDAERTPDAERAPDADRAPDRERPWSPAPAPRPAPAPAPRSAPTPPHAPGQPPAGAAPGPAPGAPALPTRVRQASLAPELRAAPPGAEEPPEREVSADEVRAIFGAYQRGLDRGRRGVPTDSGPAGTPAERTDTEEGTDAHDAP
ncbi:nitrate- and nitrite sensing domain-containing protein [Streptomyces sp. NPDC052040]|uniref:sensor histidine kinase n=1 Tax=Streptomyces sp. NPDC052040 TaxID=3365682 RepID=UPI0037CE380E